MAEKARVFGAHEAEAMFESIGNALALLQQGGAVSAKFLQELREERAMAESATEPRALTMQDRLLVVAHIETLVNDDSTLRPIADTVIECVRCCDYFPECSHVVDESERIDRAEGRDGSATARLRRRDVSEGAHDHRRVRMELSDGHMDVCLSPDASPKTVELLKQIGEAALAAMKKEDSDGGCDAD